MMRMIREISRVLFSMLFGKKYTQVETELRNKFRTEGTPQDALKDLVDHGKNNEAENMLLEDIDYESKESVAEAVLFYRYVGELSDEFLEQHVFSRQEVLDGLRNLAENAGLLGIVEMMMHDRRGGS
jgi:hypothetical protein